MPARREGGSDEHDQRYGRPLPAAAARYRSGSRTRPDGTRYRLRARRPVRRGGDIRGHRRPIGPLLPGGTGDHHRPGATARRRRRHRRARPAPGPGRGDLGGCPVRDRRHRRRGRQGLPDHFLARGRAQAGRLPRGVLPRGRPGSGRRRGVLHCRHGDPAVRRDPRRGRAVAQPHRPALARGRLRRHLGHRPVLHRRPRRRSGPGRAPAAGGQHPDRPCPGARGRGGTGGTAGRLRPAHPAAA